MITDTDRARLEIDGGGNYYKIKDVRSFRSPTWYMRAEQMAQALDRAAEKGLFAYDPPRKFDPRRALSALGAKLLAFGNALRRM